MLGKTSGIDSKMLKKDYSGKPIKKEKMALLEKSMTVGSASTASDGGIKKMIQKRKMKKALKKQNQGEAKYSRPVRRTLKKVKDEIVDSLEGARVGAMQRRAMRQAKRTGASDTCDPTKPKSCKTYSPTGTFKN